MTSMIGAPHHLTMATRPRHPTSASSCLSVSVLVPGAPACACPVSRSCTSRICSRSVHSPRPTPSCSQMSGTSASRSASPEKVKVRRRWRRPAACCADSTTIRTESVLWICLQSEYPREDELPT